MTLKTTRKQATRCEYSFEYMKTKSMMVQVSLTTRMMRLAGMSLPRFNWNVSIKPQKACNHENRKREDGFADEIMFY